MCIWGGGAGRNPGSLAGFQKTWGWTSWSPGLPSALTSKHLGHVLTPLRQKTMGFRKTGVQILALPLGCRVTL